MVTLKSTWFFKQDGPGWTETLYRTVAGGSLDTYWADALAYAQKRVVLSGAQTKLFAIRLSYEGVFRDVLGKFVNLDGTAGKDSDNPTTTLETYCQNEAHTKTKHLFMRGVWDNVITAGGIYTPTATYSAYFNSWAAELVAKEWGWLSVLNPVDAFVVTVVENVNHTIRVTLNGNLFPLPLPNYAQVRISGVGGAVELNGLQVVKPLTQASFDTKFPLAILPYTVGGKARWSDKALVVIKKLGVGHVGERRVGKPSYLPVGRRGGRRRV